MSKVNKSQQMRDLFVENPEKDISEIADDVGVRYAFAYQVIRRFVDKREDMEMPTKRNNGEPSKKDKMIQMYEDGASIADCAKAVDTNYSYAWKTIDDYRKKQQSEDTE